MMEFEVSYSLDNEQQFWEELDDIISTPCRTNESIDNALRRYLSFTASFSVEYLRSENSIAQCSYKLLDTVLFQTHKDYVRRQIIYGLLQEDDQSTLHIIAAFLLHDGRADERVFEMMQLEGSFIRLVELIQICEADNALFHRVLFELLYEMSRIQQLQWKDLLVIDDNFILNLFQIIEKASNSVTDPYHYSVIRVLLVLNEQYLVHSTLTASEPSCTPLTNRVLKILSTHGYKYKTFGENLILLLNRETEISCQLLILKLLYLLFSSASTSEYFYTNDLHVLLDVILRNLIDLPYDSSPAAALRQTYLRVLYPLLTKSQLAHPPYYKRSAIQQLLEAQLASNLTGWQHFSPVDPTTERLVRRCLDIPWLQVDIDSTLNSQPSSPNSRGSSKPGVQKSLGMSVPSAARSDLSVLEIAVQSEKPGVQAPSNRKHVKDHTLRNGELANHNLI